MAPAIKPGPSLWSGIPIEEIHELIKFSSMQLSRAYAIKAQQESKHCYVNAATLREIECWERAHDQHFSWLKSRTSDARGLENTR